ncbi:hypothetical protein H5410_034098 [Solanum commersonii]|uniref:Succinate dehydrogenase subunit 6, mitochondrial n=1 Tax=Solanum commersonii TaxID=4109 RepID=A0A9J5YSL7_SOLCO|nr:hypothetical protein H5410_034098 [Solanum commersonii]
MAEDSSSSQSFLRRHWEGYKEFWGERFSFLDNYSRFIKRDKPLPSWSDSDVEEFIASDPLHGPTKEIDTRQFPFLADPITLALSISFRSVTVHRRILLTSDDKKLHMFVFFSSDNPTVSASLRTAREAAKISAVGGIIGAVSTAGVTWKYSRSLHGTALSLGAGAVFGWTFGQEVANHWLQLYKLDTMAAQVKFMEWWQNKVEGQ